MLNQQSDLASEPMHQMHTQFAPPPMDSGDEVDMRHLLDLLWSGRWIILGILLSSLLIGFFYLVVTPPTFRADGLVQVEEDKKSSPSAALGDVSSLLLGSPVQAEAEIQILNSRMVLTQVVGKLNLTVVAEPRTFPIIGNAIFRRNFRVKEPVKVPGLLRRFAWGGEQINVPTLQVPESLLNKVLMLKAKGDDRFELYLQNGTKLLDGKVGEPASAEAGDGQISIFVRQLRAQPGTEFDVSRRALQDVLGSLLNNLTVAERGKQSGVIGITFTGRSSDFVADVVNMIEDAYLRQNVERRSAEAQRSLEFLEKQIPTLKDRVNAAQQALNAYQLRHGSVDVTQETELLLKHSVDLETGKLTLAQQRQDALQRFTPDHPVIKAIDDKLRSINDEEQKLKGQSDKLPTTQQEVLSLTRDLDVANQLYTEMLNSVQQLQIAKAGTVGNVRIVDYALQPRNSAAPKVPLVLTVALVIGIFLGSAYVLIQRVMLRGVDDPAELEARTGLTAYASIPYAKAQQQLEHKLQSGEPGNYLLSATASTDPAVEALRSLRNSLHFLMLESTNNVVMFSGPAPGIGKSFVTLNLGALLASSGKRTVVIDADLRLGHLFKYAGLPASPGVSDFVAGDVAVDAVIRPTGVPDLMIVTNGTRPPNPAELLLHEKFAQLVDHLSKAFDYVIIDTPPSLVVADAAVVGRLAGCTLVVLKSAEHPMREIEECYRRLAQAGVNVRGVVFNQVGHRVGSYGYGGYGYSYNRYYKYN